MKNYKKILSTLLLACTLVFFSSCEDNTEILKISANPTAAVLGDLSINTIKLDAVNVNNPAVTLTWEAADYGQQTPVNYIIEFSDNESFTNAVQASSTTDNNFMTLSSSQLNSLAGSAGLFPFKWTTIYSRIISYLGTVDGAPVTSNTIQFDVYPYFNYVFNDYYMVGNGVASDWNNDNNNNALFRDENNSNIFYYTGYFKNDNAGFDDGRFKVLEEKGNWQPQWGVSDPEGSDVFSTSGTIAGNPTTQSSDPGRFGVENSGFYTFTIDFANSNYTMVPFDATGKTSPAGLSLQGTSTATLAMTPMSFDGHIWFVSNIKLTPGDVEFVTNGGAKWGSTTSFSGVATDGGGAIPVIVEDFYDVWFNDLTGRYILIPLNI
ncbi:SusE domain-containing protein [Polaribacter sp.]|uniref:SusE domain-containing protein n=1 Tax=Polaribacter sp. TaxID=1920175 RepID=UPI003EF59DA2